MTPPTAELQVRPEAPEQPALRPVDELADHLGCSVSRTFTTESPDYDPAVWEAFESTFREQGAHIYWYLRKVELDLAGSSARLECSRTHHITLGPIMQALEPGRRWLHLEAAETPELPLEDLAAKLGHGAAVYRDHSPDPRPGAVILVPLGEWIIDDSA